MQKYPIGERLIIYDSNQSSYSNHIGYTFARKSSERSRKKSWSKALEIRCSKPMSMLSLRKILCICGRAQQMSFASCVAVTPFCFITSFMCCPICIKSVEFITCRALGFHAYPSTSYSTPIQAFRNGS